MTATSTLCERCEREKARENRDETRLKRVAVDERLRNQGACGVRVLDLLGGHVHAQIVTKIQRVKAWGTYSPWLSLKMFFLRSMMRSAPLGSHSPMSPLQQTQRQRDNANAGSISGHTTCAASLQSLALQQSARQPCSTCLQCYKNTLQQAAWQLPAEHVRPPEAHFTALRLAGVGGRHVVHLGHVAQAHFAARHGTSDVAGRHVVDAGEGGGGAAPAAEWRVKGGCR